MNVPLAVKGHLDLSQMEFNPQHSLELNGEWEFYWGKLLNPSTFEIENKVEFIPIKVPASWTSTKVDNQKVPVFGFATYRLKVDLPKNHEKLGLLVPKIWSASKVWINGQLVSARGKVSTRHNQNYENQILEELVMLDTKASKLEIIVQVANYDVLVSGLVQSFKLGYYPEMNEQLNLLNVRELMWIGCLLLMSFYHFILFIYRAKNTYYLFFGLACLLIALRVIVFGEHYLYAYLKEHSGILNFTWQSKIYYLSSFALIPVALYYFRELYFEECNLLIVRASAIVLGTYSLGILVFPPTFLTNTVNAFEIISIAFELYLIYVLWLATYHHRKDSFLQMLGILLMVFASVNDTLHAEEIELVGSLELTPLMFSVFVFLQFFIIARRFSQAFSQVEDLSKNLEIKVEERTVQLKEANEELQSTLDLVEQEKQKSDKLLLNILPEETAQELKEKGSASPQIYELATVLFTDFKGFTQIAEKLSPQQVIEELNTCFLAFDEICERFNLEKIKTIGDSYMCAGGLPIPNNTNPIDTVKAGIEMQKWMRKWQAEKQALGQPCWSVRIGIHSGPVVAGVIGKNKFAYDIWGDTVNLASRMESSGEADKVNISETTYELVKGYFQCDYRGKIQAKNKGEIDMYFVNETL